MERPPNMTFAQVSALFGDTSYEEQRRELAEMVPDIYFNKLQESTDRSQAAMVVNEESQFRRQDFIEGGRMYNGQIRYPFQSVDELWTGKTDQYYFDGSENNNVYHLQENMIGRPLGADFIRDPNYTYTENLMKMREARSQREVADDNYIRELYAFNTQKGSNYYETQVQKEIENLSRDTRISRGQKQRSIYVESIESDITAQGQFEHPGEIESKEDYIPSMNAYQQANFRQSRFDRIGARPVIEREPDEQPMEVSSRGSRRNPEQEQMAVDPEEIVREEQSSRRRRGP